MCLEETHVEEIQPPLQIIYLGYGCERYSPSMFLPAKNEMTAHGQIESQKEYFLKFNYVSWGKMRVRMRICLELKSLHFQTCKGCTSVSAH